MQYLVSLEARKEAIVEAETSDEAQRLVYSQLDPDIDWDIVDIRPAKPEEI